MKNIEEGMPYGQHKTLLPLVKHYKNNPVKIFNLLCHANAKVFTDFLQNKDNKIDMHSVLTIIDAILFLIKYDQYHLTNIMPLMRDDHRLSVHSFNVTMYALQLGCPLHLSIDELHQLGYAAYLHDLGKKNVDSLINLERELTDEEFKAVQKHSNYSIEIIEKNDLHDPVVLETVLQHHERFDGSGYPFGLKKEDISKLGAILAVSDVFDALTVNRPYRTSFSSFDALKLMITDPLMRKQFNLAHIKKLLSLLGLD